MRIIASRTLLAAVACLLCLGVSLPVQSQEWGIPPTQLRATPVPDYARLVLAELNRPVQLTMVDGSILKGIVGGADAAEFTLVMDDISLMESRVGVSWARISEVRIDRTSRLVEGLFLGSAAGALAGILSPLGDDTRSEYLGIEAPDRVWDTMIQGAVLGAAIGLLQGLDIVLPHTPQSSGVAGPSVPSIRRSRPTVRLVTTTPSQSLTIRDIEESLKWTPASGPGPIVMDQSWNGGTGSTIAVETSWQWDQRWWLRSRLEHTTLPTFSNDSGLLYATSPMVNREYRSWRSMVGLALPFGAVGRLPMAEVAFLAGLARTTLKTNYFHELDPNFVPVSAKQVVYRPVIMASTSLALLRRPKLAIALRAEGMMGAGFHADALLDDSGFEVIPRRRITPIGLSIGIEVLFPNF